MRRATAADSPAIQALERQTPYAAHWSPGAYADLFATWDMQENSGLQLIRLSWVAEENETADIENAASIAGFIVARIVDAEYELENIVVEQNLRRKGLGNLLLNTLIAYANPERAGIILEVRESNQPARGFYEKFGFEQVGLRKNYYSAPTENAVVYRLKLC